MTGFSLGGKAKAAGYRLAAFDSVGSTNAEALETAARGDRGLIWFAALQQTEGRGRRGRVWHTDFGNLAASLLLRPECAPEHTATLGFVAGIALRRSLGALLPNAATKTGLDGASHSQGRITLKWPNDVLTDGAKMAGILLEMQQHKDGNPAIVIGFGVNVVTAPDGLPYPTIAAQSFDPGIQAVDLFSALAENWVDAYRLWDGGQGVSGVLEEWRQSAAGIGSKVAINTDGRILRGTFEDIDDKGRLVIRGQDGETVTVAAGDVHFGTTASFNPLPSGEQV